VEWGVVGDEQVDAQVHRTRLGGVGAELFAVVARAVLVVAADGDSGVCLCHLILQPAPCAVGVGTEGGERCAIGQAHHDSAHRAQRPFENVGGPALG